MNSLIFILVYLWSSLSLAQYSRYGQAPGMIPRDELFPPQFNMMNSYLPKGNPALATDQPNGFNQNRGNVFNGGGNNVGTAGPPVPGPTGPGVWRPGQQPGWSQGSGHGQPQGSIGPEGREDGRLGYASSERGSGGPGPATTLARAPAPVTTSAAPAPAPAPASASVRVPAPAPAPAPAWSPKPHSSSESESASNEGPDTSAVESSSSSSEEPRKDVFEYKQGTFPSDRTSEYRQGTFPNSKVTEYREGPFPKPDRTAEYRQGTFPTGERETSTGSAYNFGPKDRNGGETRPTASSTESGSSYNFGPRSGGSAAGTGSKGPEHMTGTEYNFGPTNGRSNNNGNGGGTGGSTGAAGPNSGARVPSSGGGSSYNFGPREGGASVPGQTSVPQTGPNSRGGSASGSAESGYEETVPGVRVGGVQPPTAPDTPSPSAETPNTVSVPDPKPETEYGVLPGAAGGEEPSVPGSGPTDKESSEPSTVSFGSSGGAGQLTTVGAPSSHQGPRPSNSGSSVGSPSPSASTAEEVYGGSPAPAPAPLPTQSQLPSGPASIHPPPPPPPALVFSRPAPPHLTPSPAPAPSPSPAPQATGAPAVAPYQVSSPVPPLPSASGTENSLEGYGDGNVGTSSGTSGSSGSSGSAGSGATDSPPYRRENKPTPPPSPPTFSTTPYTFPSGNEVFSGSRGSSDYEESGPAAPEGHSIVITDEVEESNVPPGVDPHRETDVRIAPLPPRAPPTAVSSSSTEEPMEPVEGSQLKYVPKGSQETREGTMNDSNESSAPSPRDTLSAISSDKTTTSAPSTTSVVTILPEQEFRSNVVGWKEENASQVKPRTRSSESARTDSDPDTNTDAPNTAWANEGGVHVMGHRSNTTGQGASAAESIDPHTNLSSFATPLPRLAQSIPPTSPDVSKHDLSDVHNSSFNVNATHQTIQSISTKDDNFMDVQLPIILNNTVVDKDAAESESSNSSESFEDPENRRRRSDEDEGNEDLKNVNIPHNDSITELLTAPTDNNCSANDPTTNKEHCSIEKAGLLEKPNDETKDRNGGPEGKHIESTTMTPTMNSEANIANHSQTLVPVDPCLQCKGHSCRALGCKTIPGERSASHSEEALEAITDTPRTNDEQLLSKIRGVEQGIGVASFDDVPSIKSVNGSEHAEGHLMNQNVMDLCGGQICSKQEVKLRNVTGDDNTKPPAESASRIILDRQKCKGGVCIQGVPKSSPPAEHDVSSIQPNEVRKDKETFEAQQDKFVNTTTTVPVHPPLEYELIVTSCVEKDCIKRDLLKSKTLPDEHFVDNSEGKSHATSKNASFYADEHGANSRNTSRARCNLCASSDTSCHDVCAESAKNSSTRDGTQQENIERLNTTVCSELGCVRHLGADGGSSKDLLTTTTARSVTTEFRETRCDSEECQTRSHASNHFLERNTTGVLPHRAKIGENVSCTSGNCLSGNKFPRLPASHSKNDEARAQGPLNPKFDKNVPCIGTECSNERTSSSEHSNIKTVLDPPSSTPIPTYMSNTPDNHLVNRTTSPSLVEKPVKKKERSNRRTYSQQIPSKESSPHLKNSTQQEKERTVKYTETPIRTNGRVSPADYDDDLAELALEYGDADHNSVRVPINNDYAPMDKFGLSDNDNALKFVIKKQSKITRPKETAKEFIRASTFSPVNSQHTNARSRQFTSNPFSQTSLITTETSKVDSSPQSDIALSRSDKSQRFTKSKCFGTLCGGIENVRNTGKDVAEQPKVDIPFAKDCAGVECHVIFGGSKPQKDRVHTVAKERDNNNRKTNKPLIPAITSSITTTTTRQLTLNHLAHADFSVSGSGTKVSNVDSTLLSDREIPKSDKSPKFSESKCFGTQCGQNEQVSDSGKDVADMNDIPFAKDCIGVECHSLVGEVTDRVMDRVSKDRVNNGEVLNDRVIKIRMSNDTVSKNLAPSKKCEDDECDKADTSKDCRSPDCHNDISEPKCIDDECREKAAKNTCHGADCRKESAAQHDCHGPKCKAKPNCTGEKCVKPQPCFGEKCRHESHCAGNDCDTTARPNCFGAKCTVKNCTGPDCRLQTLNKASTVRENDCVGDICKGAFTSGCSGGMCAEDEIKDHTRSNAGIDSNSSSHGVRQPIDENLPPKRPNRPIIVNKHIVVPLIPRRISTDLALVGMERIDSPSTVSEGSISNEQPSAKLLIVEATPGVHSPSRSTKPTSVGFENRIESTARSRSSGFSNAKELQLSEPSAKERNDCFGDMCEHTRPAFCPSGKCANESHKRKHNPFSTEVDQKSSISGERQPTQVILQQNRLKQPLEDNLRIVTPVISSRISPDLALDDETRIDETTTSSVVSIANEHSSTKSREEETPVVHVSSRSSKPTPDDVEILEQFIKNDDAWNEEGRAISTRRQGVKNSNANELDTIESTKNHTVMVKDATDSSMSVTASHTAHFADSEIGNPFEQNLGQVLHGSTHDSTLDDPVNNQLFARNTSKTPDDIDILEQFIKNDNGWNESGSTVTGRQAQEAKKKEIDTIDSKNIHSNVSLELHREPTFPDYESVSSPQASDDNESDTIDYESASIGARKPVEHETSEEKITTNVSKSSNISNIKLLTSGSSSGGTKDQTNSGTLNDKFSEDIPVQEIVNNLLGDLLKKTVKKESKKSGTSNHLPFSSNKAPDNLIIINGTPQDQVLITNNELRSNLQTINDPVLAKSISENADHHTDNSTIKSMKPIETREDLDNALTNRSARDSNVTKVGIPEPKAGLQPETTDDYELVEDPSNNNLPSDYEFVDADTGEPVDVSSIQSTDIVFDPMSLGSSGASGIAGADSFPSEGDSTESAADESHVPAPQKATVPAGARVPKVSLPSVPAPQTPQVHTQAFATLPLSLEDDTPVHPNIPRSIYPTHHGQSSSAASTTSTEQELQNKPHRDEDEFPQPSESATSSHGRSSETFGSTSGQAVHNAVTDYDDDEDEERSGGPSRNTGSASGTSRTYTSGGGRVLTQSQGTTGYGFQPKTLSRVVLPNPSSKKCCSCCRGRSGGQGKHRDHTPADIDALVQELEGGGQAGGAGLGGAGRGGDPRGNSAFYKGVGQAYNGQSAGLAPRPSSYGINSGYRGYIPPVGTAGSRPGVTIGNQYTGAVPGGGGGCFCQPQQSPCCAPPRPCCPPTPPRCCSPAPMCCPQPQICCQPPPPPPAPCCPTPRPCCPQPTVPVCQRACPTCPCRRRLLAMHRIRRQAPGSGGQCQSCSTNGQPLSSSQMCGAGCRRAKRSPELLQLLGIRSGSVSPMSQCGVCRGTAMRAARTKRSFCSSSSSCSRMKRSVPWPTANSNNCVTCNNLGQVLGRFKRSPTCQQCTGTEANNRAKRSPVPCSCSTIGAIQPSSIPFPSIGMLHRKKRQAEQCDSTCCDYSACPSERPYRKFLRHLNMKSSKRQ